MYFAYSVLLSLLLVLSAPWWLLESLRHGKYRAGLRERLGSVPARLRDSAAPDTIWIHAVSVGEVLAVTRLVEELNARLPGWRVVVSTTTDTGQKLARERFGESNVFYFPLDVSWAVNAYLRSLRPKLIVLAESEFWPNLLHLAQREHVPVAVVNARVSDRSLPRYRRFRRLLSSVMRNIDVFLAQTDEDARRLVEIGAPRQRVTVGGNLKFEVKAPAASAFVDEFAAALRRDGIGPVIVAGSTLQGEESWMVPCFESVVEHHRRALLVLAPRHPERFEYVARMMEWWCERECANMRWQRRSEWDGGELPAGGVFLLDSMGELANMYQFADLAFVGGSLVPHGGHNILEAARFGVAIVVGPHTENFRDIIAIFQRADALRVVTPETLATLVTPMLELLGNNAVRKQLGRNALAVMRDQQGSTERTVAALMTLLPTEVAAER